MKKDMLIEIMSRVCSLHPSTWKEKTSRLLGCKIFENDFNGVNLVINIIDGQVTLETDLVPFPIIDSLQLKLLESYSKNICSFFELRKENEVQSQLKEVYKKITGK